MLQALAALQVSKTVGGQIARGMARPVTGDGQLGDTITRMGTKSLIEYTKSTRVEPIVLLDTTCVHLPYIEDVLKITNSIFAAYYLQAVAISVNVGRVDTVRLLDRLNPSRSVANSAAVLIGDVFASSESDSFILPTVDFFNDKDTNIRASLESDDYADVVASLEGVAAETLRKVNQAGTYINRQLDKQLTAANTVVDNISKGSYEVNEGPLSTKTVNAGRINGNIEGGVSSKTINDVSEITNLCIGKLFDVTIKSGNSSAVIPVQIRLIVSAITRPILANIFKSAAKNLSFNDRYHAWQSGQISFLKDFILCRDIQREHRETLQGDKSGTYAAMNNRRTNNQIAGALGRDPSIATMSNIAIFDASTLQEIEYAAGGSLDDFKLREQIFERTMLMMMIVIDQRREQIKFYYHSINTPTKLNLVALKTANKGTGPDVLKIIETLTKGTPPVV